MYPSYDEAKLPDPIDVRLDLIQLDGGTLSRAEVSQDVIKHYAVRMEEGIEFPPVRLFFDGEYYWPWDGHLSIMAALLNEFTVINARVNSGSLKDARWLACSANKNHGKRRDNKDIEKIVIAALMHPNAIGLSNTQIAEHCGVDESTIRKYKKKLGLTSGDPKSGLVICKNGNRMNPKNIGKHRQNSNRPIQAKTQSTSGDPKSRSFQISNQQRGSSSNQTDSDRSFNRAPKTPKLEIVSQIRTVEGSSYEDVEYVTIISSTSRQRIKVECQLNDLITILKYHQVPLSDAA